MAYRSAIDWVDGEYDDWGPEAVSPFDRIADVTDPDSECLGCGKAWGDDLCPDCFDARWTPEQGWEPGANVTRSEFDRLVTEAEALEAHDGYAEAA